MSVDKDNSIFIKCACEGEGMSVDYDPEDNYYYFSSYAPLCCFILAFVLRFP